MRSPELRKVTYVLTILIAATNGFALFMVWFFFRQLRSPIISFPPSAMPGFAYYVIIPPLFVFLELLVVIWIYRPLRPLLGTRLSEGPRNRDLFRMTLAGICSGLGLFILFTPLLLRTRPDTGLVSLILYYRTSLVTYVSVGLIGIALPVSAETVFKGIVLKTLLKDMSLLWSLLITTVAFAFIWPVFHGYWLALGLGAITCLLYSRYRSLLPPMIAHVTFTAVVFGFLAFRVLLRF